MKLFSDKSTRFVPDCSITKRTTRNSLLLHISKYIQNLHRTKNLLIQSNLILTQPGAYNSVGTALCRRGGRGFDSRDRTNTQGLKISDK